MFTTHTAYKLLHKRRMEKRGRNVYVRLWGLNEPIISFIRLTQLKIEKAITIRIFGHKMYANTKNKNYLHFDYAYETYISRRII